MENKTENRPVAIRISGVKKMYRLGQIGGGTLTADLQSWWAKIHTGRNGSASGGSDFYGSERSGSDSLQG